MFNNQKRTSLQTMIKYGVLSTVLLNIKKRFVDLLKLMTLHGEA